LFKVVRFALLINLYNANIFIYPVSCSLQMSTFTMVHHTAPHIPFKTSEEWNAAQAQLNGTVHCDYPRWIEILCHDINVHVPHHISPRIPSYNLRAAYDSIKQNWGKVLQYFSHFFGVHFTGFFFLYSYFISLPLIPSTCSTSMKPAGTGA
jgi:fatty acid desaturase